MTERSRRSPVRALPFGRLLRTEPYDVVRKVVNEARKDRVLGLAAEVAFFAVFSLFPGLLIAAGLISYLDVLVGAELAASARERTVDALQSVFTERAAPVVSSVEGVFSGRYGGLVTLGAVGALVSLSGAWAVLIAALNHAYDVPELRSWWHRRLLGLGLGLATVVAVVLTLAVLVVVPFLGPGGGLAADAGFAAGYSQVWEAVRLPLLSVVLAAWLAAVFRIAPNRHVHWADALPGAVLTTVLWLACTGGFHLYLKLIGDNNPLLGVFGGGIIVMTWAYLLSIAFLVGGEFNAVMESHHKGGGDGRRRRTQPG